jgi:hypothetical protein
LLSVRDWIFGRDVAAPRPAPALAIAKLAAASARAEYGETSPRPCYRIGQIKDGRATSKWDDSALADEILPLHQRQPGNQVESEELGRHLDIMLLGSQIWSVFDRLTLVHDSLDRINDLAGHGVVDHMACPGHQLELAARDLLVQLDGLTSDIHDLVIAAGHDYYG